MPGQEEQKYFNPRPPRGGRRAPSPALPATWTYFNPRPPRGGRPMLLRILSVAMIFQSTPSARRATRFFLHIAGQVNISIHALREEGDSSCCARSSRGGRFQSTPSARRATTALWWSTPSSAHFNPRPPRGGRPSRTLSTAGMSRYFNPRPPRGGRQIFLRCLTSHPAFQSTPSARRATINRCGL